MYRQLTRGNIRIKNLRIFLNRKLRGSKKDKKWREGDRLSLCLFDIDALR
jgi:hypothetical protein